MNVALFTNPNKNHASPISIGIVEFLKLHKIKVFAEDKIASEICAEPFSKMDPKHINFIISLGGDGTILRLFHAHPELHAPLLGINMGGLGFMADITIEDIYPSLEHLLQGRYEIQERLMLDGETLHKEVDFAINDIVIHRGRNPSLVELAIYIDGNYLNTFSADGIILSTPNGSTAYSLAAGGPILTPNLEAVVITPISPHTISNRPIVLLPKKEIQVRYLGTQPGLEIIFDGCTTYSLHPGEVFRTKISKRRFKLVNMLNYDYFATVRTKLGWTGKLKK